MDTANTAAAIKFLGFTDDFTTCECCGKKNLKSTVAISIDGGEAIYYGVTCAARALRKDVRYIKNESASAERAKADRERAERNKAFDDAQRPWFQFLATHGKGEDNFRRIESLGGYQAARAMFARIGTP